MSVLVSLANGLIVDQYQIAGTDCTVFETWEAYAGHSTYRHDDNGVKLGKGGSRELPALLDAMPRGMARYEAVRAWYDAQYAESYAAILEAYPKLRDLMPFGNDSNGAAIGYGSMGAVTISTRVLEAA